MGEDGRNVKDAIRVWKKQWKKDFVAPVGDGLEEGIKWRKNRMPKRWIT